MKKLGLALILCFCCLLGFAKNPEPKTFLAIFKVKELKEMKTSLRQIESQFSDIFKTKIYSGNSELALLIEVPGGQLDECILGELLVNLEGGKKIQLQNLAFRLFDLSENQALHDTYMSMYEEALVKKKKEAKEAKSARQISAPVGGPGH